MDEILQWWQKPRTISIVVDNDSWVLPYAQTLVADCIAQGDDAKLCRTHQEIRIGAVACYLGCIKITPSEILSRNKRNLVVHASDLPKGRGFSPWTYAVLEGKAEVAICLIDAVKEVDAGNIIYKDWIALEGTELVDDLRRLIGQKSVDLCHRFLSENSPPLGFPQNGDVTICGRRRPSDSRLHPEKTIAEQFNVLRVVDNRSYPAFFEYRGKRYKLAITLDDRDNV